MADTQAAQNADAVNEAQKVASVDDAQKSKAKRDPSKVFVSNAANLKEEAPEVHEAMLRAAARDICDDLKKHAERMKKIMREGQRH